MADTLTITDNRTGKQYDIPIKEGAIRATDLKQIKSDDNDTGLGTYDPAFLNTGPAAAPSRISTATKASSGIAAIRSSTSRNTATISRRLI